MKLVIITVGIHSHANFRAQNYEIPIFSEKQGSAKNISVYIKTKEILAFTRAEH